MDIVSRNLANLFWLEKFTVFKPENIRPVTSLNKSMLPWGNYSIGQNLYPQLFEVFVKYSPSANFILNKLSRYAFGNIPENIKNLSTVFEGGYSDTLQAQIKRAGKDYFLFGGAFAIWVGYDADGYVNEFRTIPVSRVRYVSHETFKNCSVSRETTTDVSRETYGEADGYSETKETILTEAENTLTDQKYLIGIVDNNTATNYESIYFPFEPQKAKVQIDNFDALQKADPKLKSGQILFFNPASISQVYPDCGFDSSLPLLLADAGIDTLVMSFLGNADILKTYMRNSGGGGADMVNNSQLTANLWASYDNGAANFSTVPQDASAYYQTGVKSAGQTESVNLMDDVKIQDSVYIADFPTFTDELNKIDERTGRRLCAALEMPYELLFKMESGVINQDNRAAMIGEINMLLQDVRSTLEQVFNKIIECSTRPFIVEILPFGSGQEEVKQASSNVTE